MNPNDTNDHPSNPDDSDWEAVLNGKRLARRHDTDEQLAEQARQVLLWRQARRELQHTEAPDSDATRAYYAHVHKLAQQRRKQQGWRKLRGFIPALLLIGSGIGIGYYLVSPELGTLAPSTTDKATSLPAGTTPAESTPAPAITHGTESTSTPATPTTTTSPPSSGSSDKVGDPGDIPDMIQIPGGEYTMGCTPGWDDTLGGCRASEYPAHTVTLPTFRLARHEVTVGQFKRFVADTGYQTIAEQNHQGCTIPNPANPGQWILSDQHNWRNPGFPQTNVHPVVCISWQDANHYLDWLNTKTSGSYRLPSEEEWEYAARSGRITAFYWGHQPDHHFANYAETSTPDIWTHTAPVGQFTANPFGLHDMAGNVWEWTASCWRPDYQSQEPKQPCISSTNTLRVRRGGGWDTQAPSIRSAYRSFGSEVERSYVYGFRVAQDAGK
ncbi:formylglycine-generating enzyme family protein [Thiofilum flexile]|uniref:formylglycine-generating enzyme family protein n=1 Tax=Thiofilum flexile TaxID=125627 RepID=UPI000382EB46|nr:formylglycine-generating enzyme family protein [Thiofilum flexile]